MTKHHPGPLYVGYENGFAVAIHCQPDEHDKGLTICEMTSSRSPEETKANAVLFAAAPDLLKALEDAVTALQYHMHYGDPAIPNGQAAIRKARGEIL